MKYSAIIFLLLFTFPSSIHANSEDRLIEGDTRREFINERQNRAKERIVEKDGQFNCRATEARIQSISKGYEVSFKRRVLLYENLLDRLDNLLLNLTEQEYDTSTAINATLQFREKVNNLNIIWEGFNERLTNAQNEACEEGDKIAFRAEISEARAELRELRKEMNSLRPLYQEEVKPQLLQLREQIRARNAEEGSSDELLKEN